MRKMVFGGAREKDGSWAADILLTFSGRVVDIGINDEYNANENWALEDTLNPIGLPQTLDQTFTFQTQGLVY